jgi:hypothetical protein
MDSRLYPGGKSVRGRYNAQGFGQGGVFTALNASGAFLYGIDPVLKQFYGAGMVNFIRTRAVIATINAGFTLLAAKPGLKYKMVDCAAVAYGGAVAAVTTVDVKGTQSSLVKLVAFGQAALTQSALVRAGEAGGVLLADAASYVACDVNTAITVDITGSDITTATGMDFLFSYVVEE